VRDERVGVRLAEDGDVEAAAATLAAAFTGYVWADWTVAADGQERRLYQGFDLILRHVVLPHGELWISSDCAAAAVWIPPGRSREVTSAFAAISAPLREFAGCRAEAADGAEAEVATVRPSTEHWYLASMGTRPERQGQGLGSAVLAPVLSRLDTSGEPAYTETSTAENAAFYSKRGFRVIRELQISGGGPRVWGMLRGALN
jgi:GNAT superfamily N-acetyltransferase